MMEETILFPKGKPDEYELMELAAAGAITLTAEQAADVRDSMHHLVRMLFTAWAKMSQEDMEKQISLNWPDQPLMQQRIIQKVMRAKGRKAN